MSPAWSLVKRPCTSRRRPCPEPVPLSRDVESPQQICSRDAGQSTEGSGQSEERYTQFTSCDH